METQKILNRDSIYLEIARTVSEYMQAKQLGVDDFTICKLKAKLERLKTIMLEYSQESLN
jgi:hypothetical protein